MLTCTHLKSVQVKLKILWCKDFKGPKPAGKAMGGMISPSEEKNTKLRTPKQKEFKMVIEDKKLQEKK